MSKTNTIDVEIPCNYNEIGILLALPYQISHVSFSVRYTEYNYDSNTIYIIEEYFAHNIVSQGKYYGLTTAQNDMICKYYEQDMDELNKLLEATICRYEESFFDKLEYNNWLRGDSNV